MIIEWHKLIKQYNLVPIYLPTVILVNDWVIRDKLCLLYFAFFMK